MKINLKTKGGTKVSLKLEAPADDLIFDEKLKLSSKVDSKDVNKKEKSIF